MDLNPKVLLNQLVKNGDITQAEADKIEVASLKKDLNIKEYLYQYSQVPKIKIVKAMSEVIGIPFIDLENSPIDSQAIGLISESVARSYQILPSKYDAKESMIYVGTSDPYNTRAIDFLEKK